MYLRLQFNLKSFLFKLSLYYRTDNTRSFFFYLIRDGNTTIAVLCMTITLTRGRDGREGYDIKSEGIIVLDGVVRGGGREERGGV